MFECKKCSVIYPDSDVCLICGKESLSKEKPSEFPYVMRDWPV